MRFDRTGLFYKKASSRYNPKTGKVEEGETAGDKLAVSVRSLSLEERQELFGRLDFEGLVLVVKGRAPAYDYVLFEGKKYAVLGKQDYRQKTGFILGEAKL